MLLDAGGLSTRVFSATGASITVFCRLKYFKILRHLLTLELRPVLAQALQGHRGKYSPLYFKDDRGVFAILPRESRESFQYEIY